MAGIGHNSAPDLNEEEKQFSSLQAVLDYMTDRQHEMLLLDVEEIGMLDGISRLKALRIAEVVGIAKYYRLYPNADVGPGLFSMICHLSDNGHGYCWMSVARLADRLGRSRQAVGQALRRLEEAGLIIVKRREGLPNIVAPAIDKRFADCQPAVVAALDQVKNWPQLAGPDKPACQVAKKPAITKRKLTPDKPALRVVPDKPALQVPDKPPLQVPDKPACHYTTNRNTTKRKTANDSPPAAPSAEEWKQVDLEDLIPTVDSGTSAQLEPIEGDIFTPTSKTTSSREKADVEPKPKKSGRRPLVAVMAEVAPELERVAEEFVAERGGPKAGWTEAFVRDRLQAFESFYAEKKICLELKDWPGALKRWLMNPNYQPKTSYRGRPSLDDLANDAFN